MPSRGGQLLLHAALLLVIARAMRCRALSTLQCSPNLALHIAVPPPPPAACRGCAAGQ